MIVASPKGDQLEFSPNNILTSSREKVMRTNKINDHEEGDSLVFYQILSTCYFRKCIEIIVENLFVDIEAEMV